MNTNKSIISDFLSVVFTPKRFFNTRFMSLTSRRIFALGFMGVMLGLGLGGLITVFFTNAVIKDFSAHQELYLNVIKNLGLTDKSFLELIHAQRAYSWLMVGLSPVIAYMAPHILSGALLVFIWLLMRPSYDTIKFQRLMECTAMSLTSMAYYIIPAVGPVVATVMVAVNLSRALMMQYQMTGVMKIIVILSAMYISFFLTGATLQVLAQSF